jgi:hypothetical protein
MPIKIYGTSRRDFLKVKPAALAIIAMLGSTGCFAALTAIQESSMTSYVEAKPRMPPIKPETGRVYIYQKLNTAARGTSTILLGFQAGTPIWVALDDSKAFPVINGHFFVGDLPAGSHVLKLTESPTWSGVTKEIERLSIEVPSGQAVYVELSHDGKPLRLVEMMDAESQMADLLFSEKSDIPMPGQLKLAPKQ